MAHWQLQLERLAAGQPSLLTGIRRGVEKESLRIGPEGTLAQTPHPPELGSALTHGSITTDYSEALLEFITPVSTGIGETLETLADIHGFVYRQLGNERLWALSMPCIVSGDAGIPVARYGHSNVARMKTVYRLGLGHRYGRMMQTIAGIHYNFSPPEAYWDAAWEDDGTPGSRQDYITDRYLGLIRNFHRWSWLLIYLFGASPAVCASFLRGRRDHALAPMDPEGNTLYRPHATSLRMGGLGYSSEAQSGLSVCYNTLDAYLEALRDAILTPHPPYARYPSGEDGDYQQLNDSLLQIENEFYSTIRPKRVAVPEETALTSLRRGGIEYIEVRCLDVNPFTPLGLDEETMRFLDAFLLHCLVEESPPCSGEEQARLDANLATVVDRGREPGLTLASGSGTRPLAELATERLAGVARSAALLDAAHGDGAHRAAVAAQEAKVADPSITPSARMLGEMARDGLPFYRFGLRYSERWAQYFRERPLSAAARAALENESERSRTAQAELEAADSQDFARYLAAYYDQYAAL